MMVINEDFGKECMVVISGDYGKESVVAITGDYLHRAHVYPQDMESQLNSVVITLPRSLLTVLLPAYCLAFFQTHFPCNLNL